MGVEKQTSIRNVAGIADVARLSGVSKATVSKALHPSHRYGLSDQVRARVTRAASQLGYRPSWRGQLLASGKTYTIGLLYARTTPLPGDTYERTVAAAAEVLLPRGYHLMHMPLIGAQEDWQSVLQAHRIDGCLVVPPMETCLAGFLQKICMRSVLVSVDTELPLSQVQADDTSGIMMLVKHLLDLGHRRIAFCDGGAGPCNHGMAMRSEGYCSALQEAHVAQGPWLIPSAEEFVRRWSRDDANRITAVVAGDLSIAIDLLHQFWRAGISVPGDVSVATFGDSYPADKVTPPLTAVRVPAEQIGREAATLLLDQIEEKQSLLPRKIIVRESLVVRESTAPPAH